jgi:hypothetical protein
MKSVEFQEENLFFERKKLHLWNGWEKKVPVHPLVEDFWDHSGLVLVGVQEVC